MLHVIDATLVKKGIRELDVLSCFAFKIHETKNLSFSFLIPLGLWVGLDQPHIAIALVFLLNVCGHQKMLRPIYSA